MGGPLAEWNACGAFGLSCGSLGLVSGSGCGASWSKSTSSASPRLIFPLNGWVCLLFDTQAVLYVHRDTEALEVKVVSREDASRDPRLDLLDLNPTIAFRSTSELVFASEMVDASA